MEETSIGDHLTAQILPVYREHGLGDGEFDVLATLRRSGPPYERTPSDLSAMTMVTSGAISKRVDRLETAGLVTRRASDQDGRGRVVQLTDPGRELIDTAFQEHIRNEHRLLEGLSEDDRRTLARILGTWLERVEHEQP